MKKGLAMILSMAVIITCILAPGFSASAAVDHEGSTFLICGNSFEDLSSTERIMTDNGDGSYSYPLHIGKGETATFYVTEEMADGNHRNYFYYDFLGDEEFSFKTNTEQDVTILFNPDKNPNVEILGGDIRPLFGDYIRVYAFVDGSDQFTYEDGLMTADENGLFSVTFKDMQPREHVLFDVYVEYSGEPIIGYYGYNYFPADITEACDVTVYFQPDYSHGGIYAYLENTCKIWATGDNLAPKHTFPYHNFKIHYVERTSGKNAKNTYHTQPMKQTGENTYEYVIENTNLDNSFYFSFSENTDWYMALYAVSYNNNQYVENVLATTNTELEAIGYPFMEWNSPIVNFSADYKYCNVKVTLDLSDFDYVEKNGARVKLELSDMMMDVNMDGKVSIQDVTELQRCLAEFNDFSKNQSIAADVNGDKRINIHDVTALQRILAE